MKPSILQIACAAGLVLSLVEFARAASDLETAAEPAGRAESTPSHVEPLAYYRQVIEQSATRAGLPPAIVDAVMAVESGYDPQAVGTSGEIGLMQVLPSTARMLGFSGTLTELATPEINIRYGVSYLAGAWHLADGDLCTAVMKYRAGHGETRFSAKSVDYCLAVRAKLVARHYPVTGRVPVPNFGERTRSTSCKPLCLAGTTPTTPNFEPLNKRLSEIVWQTSPRASRGL